MTHAANLSALADSLITAVTGQTPDDPAFPRLKDATLKGLRDRRHARTNQYAVNDSVQGLIEKFVVQNRDDLADSLEFHFSKLSVHSGWTPEILALLLELSDRPATKSKHDEPDHVDEEVPAQSLSHDDILSHDLDEDSVIWDTIERGYHSSGDDEAEERSEPTVSTLATSIEESDPIDIAKSHLRVPDNADLRAVQEAYNLWDTQLNDADGLQLPEIVITRDVIAMLHGYPTDIFQKDVATGRVTIVRKCYISTASLSSMSSILQSLADTGTTLNALRFWTSEPQDLSYIQAIQAVVERHLFKFAQHLGDIEQVLFDLARDTVLSVADVAAKIKPAAQALVQITSSIQACPHPDTAALALLDCLYDSVTVAQMAGNLPLYEALLDMFLAGLSTYLRSVHSWVTAGAVDRQAQELFFIEEVNANCPLSDFWHGRFEMRETDLVPMCVRAVADEIFAIGKTVSFLQSLRNTDTDETAELANVFWLEKLEKNHELEDLTPFPERVQEALDQWLTSVALNHTALLTTTILESHGLRDVMIAVPALYFSQDSSHFQALAGSLARHLGPTSNKGWSDQFLLTELAHDALVGLPAVQLENIYVYITADRKQRVPTGTTQRMGHVYLRYSLPWPVQNVTRCSTPKVHAQILSFLLQLEYCRSAISECLFGRRSGSKIAAETREILKLQQRILCFVSIFMSHATLIANSIHNGMRKKMECASNMDAMVAVWAEYEKALQNSLLVGPKLEPLRESVVRVLLIGEAMTGKVGQDRGSNAPAKFDKEIGFLSAGLRSLGRVGGHELEALAERLEWCLQS